jgi:hypothetical protein
MANKDNKCADLNTLDQKSKDWDFIFNLQKSTQENTYGFKFDSLSLEELSKFWCVNKHALDDEICEMFDALGGIDDGIGNAAWKYWKADHEKAKTMKVEDLTDNDLKELKFEIVDAFHFLINFAVSINMSGSDLFNMFKAKNLENIARQKNNY